METNNTATAATIAQALRTLPDAPYWPDAVLIDDTMVIG